MIPNSTSVCLGYLGLIQSAGFIRGSAPLGGDGWSLACLDLEGGTELINLYHFERNITEWKGTWKLCNGETNGRGKET